MNMQTNNKETKTRTELTYKRGLNGEQVKSNGENRGFVAFRLGQSYVGIGNSKLAKKYLSEAYFLDGEEYFEDEESYYIDLIRSDLRRRGKI